MGQSLGCGQRQSEDKQECFSKEQLQILTNQFNKFSKVADGKSGIQIGYQGFQQLFLSNKKFARRLFRWTTKRDMSTENLDFKSYKLCAECFLCDDNQLWSKKNSDVRQYSKLELFGIVSLENQIQGQEFDREFVNRVQIRYSEGLQIIKELIQIFYNEEDMENPHIENDDIASKMVANGIYKSKESLEFIIFFKKLSEQFQNAEIYIKNYIHEAFMGLRYKDRIIPTYHFINDEQQPSLILRKSISAVLCLSSQVFGDYQYLKPLYEFLSYQEFDYDQFSKCLLNYNEGPTLILLRHIENFEEVDDYAAAKGINPDRIGKNHYVLGILNNTNYRLYPQLSGDSSTSFFSIIPSFQMFKASQGNMGQQFANLSLQDHSNGIKEGLSIGGDPKIGKARIFIGSNLQNSYITNQGKEDSTYPSKQIFESEIQKLNLDIVEIWGLSNIKSNNEKLFQKDSKPLKYQEDIGVMKSQDNDCISELDNIHSRITFPINYNQKSQVNKIEIQEEISEY